MIVLINPPSYKKLDLLVFSLLLQKNKFLKDFYSIIGLTRWHEW